MKDERRNYERHERIIKGLRKANIKEGHHQNSIKTKVIYIIYYVFLNIAVKSKSRAITFRHKKKLLNLRKKQNSINNVILFRFMLNKLYAICHHTSYRMKNNWHYHLV